ncbi:MAG: CDP-alcohol phosphatidyltransferase family protein [Firmicutes bacterium]|nr:CDP-alcohol phosphatidyltransferase family protein [Bacillota bacterium]
MKHLANIISISRIILLITLIYFYKNEVVFMILYLLCGLSDVLDGYIARRTNTQSSFGAKLDSLADLGMSGIIITMMIIWAGDQLTIFFPWLIVIILIRCANMMIAAYKYHSFVILHTWGNKLTGLLLFITPLVFVTTHRVAILWPVCIIAVLSAVEEGAIHLTANKLDVNRRSIFKGK